MNKLDKIIIKGKEFKLPVFFPDATRGVIRSLDSIDLENVGTLGLIVNTYHLLSQPGTKVLSEVGGIKKLMDWNGWIISDSGGFQMFSIVQKNKKLGKLHDNGVDFYLSSKGQKQKYEITPEKCIQIQFDIGSDIMIALDYFTPFNANKYDVAKSVDLTIKWGNRCKDEFDKQCKLRGFTENNRPLLFGVVQGAHIKEERTRCAVELEKIGFDGYGLGGWTFTEDGKMDLDIISHIASVTPDNKPRYGLGIGDPQSVVDLIRIGYQIFDCVLPTRDARHKRLYIFSKDPDKIENIFEEKDWYEYIGIGKEMHSTNLDSVSSYCDCYTCKNNSKAYLNHLFKIGDSTAFRLATIHNLAFYNKVIELATKHLK